MNLMRDLAAGGAALLLLTGCSSVLGDSFAGADPSGNTTASTTAAESAESDGRQQVTADQAGIRFEVAEDWTILGADALDNPGSAAAFEEFSETSGLSTEQIKQMAAQVDVLVISPDGSENVNVIPPGAVRAMPNEASLTSDFELFGATVSGVEQLETPLGQGRVAYYVLPVGGVEQHGASLFVETDDGIVNVTATTSSASRAPDLMADVAETLEQVG